MAEVYRFGAFRLEAGDRLLFRQGELVPLAPKAIDTLVLLVANHGRIVEKDELLKTVWPDTFVEEGGLARNISVLRKALGSDEYIETIPKRGYRFVGEVREGTETAEPPKVRNWKPWVFTAAALILVAIAAVLVWRARETQRAAHAVRSIAVLPLKNLSNAAGQEYLSEGIPEVLTANLARVHGLQVIPPASAARGYKADAVIRGAVLSSGNRVRVTAQLVDVRTGWLLWAGTYDRDLGDVLVLEAELAETIAREVNVTLTPEERHSIAARASGPEASEAYLRGRYCWNRRTEESLRQAIHYFSEALRRDPNYALAHAGLADAYALLGSIGYDAMPPAEAMPLARAAAGKALALDPRLAEARTTLAYISLAYDWDLQAAGDQFRAALERNPGYATAHHWYGHYWLAAGRPERALAEMTRAQELQPDSLPIMVGVGWSHYFAGNYDAAVAQYRKALDMDPNFALAHQTLGMAYQRKGMLAEAIASLEKAVALSGGDASAVAALGAAYAQAGDRQKAREQLERLHRTAARRYVPAVLFGLVLEALGERAESVAWVRKGLAERSDYFVYLGTDPGFQQLLRDPRVAAALPENFRRPL